MACFAALQNFFLKSAKSMKKLYRSSHPFKKSLGLSLDISFRWV
ncbi:hypothetical protein D1BOALGB6SA_8468 [Olavius sp. associated proteobacterium Delta 1]|nr:hypothetical protein D1BOALGB6SA_8468 [Olavius sp. associated proteobacterium Delta 1]